MEERFTRSVICPTLIGREGDLATLQWLVEETKCGQGRVAFVSGEAGVGKSRLITETAHFAEQQGFFHLQGQCFQTDSALPYAPFLDLLRSYMMASTPEQIVQEWEPIAPELLRLLPEVRGLIPAFASVLPLPALDPQQEKRRLFGAMTHFCTRLVTRQPLLLVVEDLHWCDDIGLECLFHLARHTARLPLFLLLSYRNDEVSARLRHWLATFDRGYLAQEVVLARLSLVDVDAMLLLTPEYNCARIKLTVPRTGCTLCELKFSSHTGGSHDQEQDSEYNTRIVSAREVHSRHRHHPGNSQEYGAQVSAPSGTGGHASSAT